MSYDAIRLILVIYIDLYAYVGKSTCPAMSRWTREVIGFACVTILFLICRFELFKLFKLPLLAFIQTRWHL